MIRIYYELGPEDDNAIISVQSLDVLSDIGIALEPGSYWIDRVTVREAWDPEEGWVYRRLYEPHGRLEVQGPGEWSLSTLVPEDEMYVV